jgi:endonuclease YncB( thermonuclease family)
MRYILTFLLLVTLPKAGLCLEVDAFAVATGDSLVLQDEGGALVNFRISCITAPYFDQESWQDSRSFLGKVLQGEIRFGKVRSLADGYEGEVFAGGRNVCYSMVEAGYAWASTKLPRSLRNEFELLNDPLYRVETEAKKKKAGLWASSSFTPRESKMRREDEGSRFQIVADAFAADDAKKTSYQLCMEKKFGRGFKAPSATYTLVGVLIDGASVECGGKKIYNAKMPVPSRTEMQLEDINSNLRAIRHGY